MWNGQGQQLCYKKYRPKLLCQPVVETICKFKCVGTCTCEKKVFVTNLCNPNPCVSPLMGCAPCLPLCPPKKTIYGDFVANSLVGSSNQANLMAAVTGYSGVVTFSASNGTISIPYAGRYQVTYNAAVLPVDDPTSLNAYLDTGGSSPSIFSITQQPMNQGANIATVSNTSILTYAAPGFLRLLFSQHVTPATISGTTQITAPISLVITGVLRV